jgi:hypothetical protein
LIICEFKKDYVLFNPRSKSIYVHLDQLLFDLKYDPSMIKIPLPIISEKMILFHVRLNSKKNLKKKKVRKRRKLRKRKRREKMRKSLKSLLVNF